MQQDHVIPGKDASLECAIASMQAQLLARGFEIEECDWLNPVDNVWSVRVRNRACHLMLANGRGATRLAAHASALGEYFERLSCNYFWNHYYLGETIANRAYTHSPRERWFPLSANSADWPSGLLTPELQRFYNAGGNIPAEALVDMNSGNEDRGICAIPYVRQSDGAEVFFPVNIISNLYGSNGMAAGNTQAEARAQALSEIFERHVKFKVIAEGLCLPDVPDEVISRYPNIVTGIRGLRDAGFTILVKDASLGGLYPVMCVTVLNPRDQGVIASFGAHPRLAIALERALTELLQGRSLAALDGFPPPGLDLDEIASTPNMELHFASSSGIVSWEFLAEEADFDFVDWNFNDLEVGKTADDYAWLCERIQADGYDIYVANFDHLGVAACRILIPGMSEIYPLDKLEWENNSNGNIVRADILQLADLNDDESCDLLDTLNELNIADERLVADLIGLVPDAGSLWAELRVGELKTMLALAGGAPDALREGLQWVRQFEPINAARRRIYTCIKTLIELDDPADYETALFALFDEATLDQAVALLDGDARFFGLTSPGPDLAGCELHQQLLREYEKAQA